MDQPRTKPYILTGGLVPLLRNRHRANISHEVAEDLRAIEHAYFSEVGNLLNGRKDRDSRGEFLWNVQFISDKEICKGLRGVMPKERSLPLISFDDVYCPDLANGVYSITRIVDPENLDAESKLGPRIGAPGLEDQVRLIREKYGDRIDIMDIGSFCGGTICDEIANRFNKFGVKINDVYLFLAGDEALGRLSAAGVNPKIARRCDWVDWLEMRDCLGFDGRKVKWNKETDRKPENVFVKYTERSEKWASIPLDAKQTYDDLYHRYFRLAQAVLRGDGFHVSLDKLGNNGSCVYELNISPVGVA